eukprot:m.50146 g.50146  ORF g.50146 m.50146 type:complete len:394 (-) comp8995_c0_seq1:24-1205(-)
MSDGKRAEMLKKAKDAMVGKKPEGNEHKIIGKKDEEITVTQADLPETPVLFLQGCEGCGFTFAPNVTVVKVLIEGLKRCKITIPQSAKITTSVVEIWRCEDVEFDTSITIGTLQLDLSSSLAVQFARVEQLGQLVQAGVNELRLSFSDNPALNVVTGTAAIRASICPDLEPEDNSTQFITRYVAVDGGENQLLTEEILRLANDFPTTAREKAAHDRDIEAKHKALHEMAGSLLSGAKGALSEADKKDLEGELTKASAGAKSDLGAEATVEARAEYRRQLGNEQFKIGEYQQAAVHYTEAIDLKQDIASVWCNRAMCWLKLAHADKALVDADACIALDAEYTKAHFRRGVALYQLERYREACEAYGKALQLEPTNDQAKASLRLAERKLALESQ